jgi:hypothetical protein
MSTPWRTTTIESTLASLPPAMPSSIAQSRIEFTPCFSGDVIAHPSWISGGMPQSDAASIANAV